MLLFISFMLLSLNCIVYSNDLVTWQSALSNASGVYWDAARAPNLNHTVIITASNYGYLNHFYNFKCFLDRLGLKFLLISLDRRTHHEVLKSSDKITSIHFTGNVDIVNEAQKFRSRQFNIISRRKMDAVYKVLELGYDVMFIDTDVILVNDPVPIMIWNNVDYVHAVNMFCPRKDWDFWKSEEEGNTGFYFARSNSKILKLWRKYHIQAELDSNEEIDDQTLFWKAVRLSNDPPITPLPICSHQLISDNLLTCHPDTCEAGAGAVTTPYEFNQVKDNLRKNKLHMISIHANYLIGNEKKQSKLNEHGLWIATQASHSKTWDGPCKSYQPPI